MAYAPPHVRANTRAWMHASVVLRRSNGYFVYSSIEGVSFQPRDLPTEPVTATLGVGGRLIPGLDVMLIGMRPGDRYRILIPAALAYGPDATLLPQPPGFAASRQLIVHRNEPMLFEVELIKVKPKNRREGDVSLLKSSPI